MFTKSNFTTIITIMVFAISRGSVRAQENFVERRFKDAVDKALRDVERILGTTKHPVMAGDADHLYEDKYLLAEFLTNTAMASYVTALERIGLNEDAVTTGLSWAQEEKQAVTLDFSAELACEFDKKEERQVVTSQREVEVTKSGYIMSGTKKETVQVKETVMDFLWNVKASYRISMRKGVDEDNVIVLGESYPIIAKVVTTGKVSDQNPRPPFPDRKVRESLAITWLLQNLSELRICDFSIDRSDEECKTPRRNKDVEASLTFKRDLREWVQFLGMFLGDMDRNLQRFRKTADGKQSSGLLEDINTDNIFNPILPLFDNSTVLSAADSNALLSQQAKSLDSEIAAVAKIAEEKDTALSRFEAILFLVLKHLDDLGDRHFQSVQYVEHLLEQQLFQAIGKRISPSAFDEFMSFHNQKFFDAMYTPKPFTYAVRRPGHYPDGIFSIESPGNQGPIETLVRTIPDESNPPALYMPVSAATKIELQGDRFLHGWIQHVWNSENSPPTGQFQLAARAHQFSSFLLVVGVMGGPDTFLPKQAIILQNKDEVLIPLLTNVLPSAKEFKDAISSLSPEQQEFAKAFRAMQLESSVFGIAVIQLKPQLEKLLNLPEGALTKEIQLTQDLMSLFVDYQIPSDLLSFDANNFTGGEEEIAVSSKVDAVKGYVKAVMEVIEAEKSKQLKEEEEKKKMRYNMESSNDAAPFGGGAPFGSAPSAKFGSAPSAGPSASQPPMEWMRRAAYSPTPGPTVASDALPKMQLMSDASYAMTSYSSGSRALRGELEESADDFEEEAPPEAEATQENKQSSSPEAKQSGSSSQSLAASDFTMIPKLLDRKLEELDKEGALRSTTVKAGSNGWQLVRQENLLRAAVKKGLSSEDIKSEKNKAFDLLTAISRSGSLPIASAQFHVVIAVSHCFEKDVIGTIIRDNINPIEKVEKSLLMIGSVIHNEYPTKLLAASQKEKEGLLTEE
jgi:hypothetical protein